MGIAAVSTKTTRLVIFEDEVNKMIMYSNEIGLDDQLEKTPIESLAKLKEYLQKRPYYDDTIFWLDVNMTKNGGRAKDGFEAIKLIKECYPNSLVPIIMYSGNASEEDCYTYGATFFQTKIASELENEMKYFRSIIESIIGKSATLEAYQLPPRMLTRLHDFLYNLNRQIPNITSARSSQSISEHSPFVEKSTPFYFNKVDVIPPSKSKRKPPVIFNIVAEIAIPEKVKMTRAAQIYFGKKVLIALNQMKEDSIKRGDINLGNSVRGETKVFKEPASGLEDVFWVAGNISWNISYFYQNEALNFKETPDNSMLEFFYDREKGISKIKIPTTKKEFEIEVTLDGVESIIKRGYRKSLKKMSPQNQIILNLLIAQVCARHYMFERNNKKEKKRIFKIARVLDSEWKLEIQKYIIQGYLKQRKPLTFIKKAIKDWKEKAACPEVFDIIKGKVTNIDRENNLVNVELLSSFYPSWDALETWESGPLLDNNLTKDSYFLYTAIKISDTIHGFDIEIVDYA